MKTIRRNVFETNSSSMHALVIPRHSSPFNSDETRKVTFDLNTEYSYRRLVMHDNPDGKAGYAFHLLIDIINTKLVTRSSGDKFSDEELNGNRNIMQRLKKCFRSISKYCKTEFNVIAKFTGYKLYTGHLGIGTSGYDYCDIRGTKGFTYTGCYGNDMVVSILEIDRIAKQVIDYIDGREHDDWFCMYSLLGFVLDDNGILIQNTDECDDADEKTMLDAIRRYAKQCKYMCNIVWPFGG